MKATSPVLARESVAGALDWHDIADERLQRITELEQMVAVTTARLNGLQNDRHRLVQAHHAEVTLLKQQLADLHKLQLEAKLEVALRREMEMLTSTSWRVTRPLRALSLCVRYFRRLLSRGED